MRGPTREQKHNGHHADADRDAAQRKQQSSSRSRLAEEIS
jgi:hypothetical protein